MPNRPAALYCDEDVSVVLAAMLRARGFRVATARDSGHLGLPLTILDGILRLLGRLDSGQP